MSDFNDQLVVDADQYTNIAGVAMTYKPAGGGTRSIVGVILYDGTSPLPGIDVTTVSFVISVKNDSTYGISSDELSEGGQDKISISPRIDLAAMDRPITRMLSQDAGMVQLAVK